MSEKSIYMLCMTVIAVAGISALTAILLLYPGDKEVLIGQVVSGVIALMTWLRVNKVVGDNAKANDAVVKVSQSIATKVDSVNEKASAKVEEVLSRVADLEGSLPPSAKPR